MPENNTYDAIVIGSGISGGWAAKELTEKLLPEINAGTASLYMATINPLVGLTTYLAQMVLAKPLVRAGTSEFRVDGTWSDPRVTKVD